MIYIVSYHMMNMDGKVQISLEKRLRWNGSLKVLKNNTNLLICNITLTNIQSFCHFIQQQKHIIKRFFTLNCGNIFYMEWSN